MQEDNGLSASRLINFYESMPRDSDERLMIEEYFQRVTDFTVPCHFEGHSTCLIIKNRHLDLSSQKKIFELFHLFLGQDHHRLTYDEIADGIYPVHASREFSYRFIQSRRNRVAKLMTRARQAVAQVLHDPVEKHKWFVFDSLNKQWCLHQPRHAMPMAEMVSG